MKNIGHRPSDSRLASTGHAAEPKYATITVALSPLLDVVKNLRTGSYMAFGGGRRILLERIKGGVFGTGQFR